MIRIELDVSYKLPRNSGISAYTAALAQELAQVPEIKLVLLVAGDTNDLRFPNVPTRRICRRDRLRVRRGWVRVVPHQMRPAPAYGQCIVSVHDVIHLGPWASRLKRLAFRFILATFKRRGVSILAVSHATRSRLISLGFDPQKIGIAHSSLPARTTDSADTPSCGGGGFVYVGNLRAHKGVEFLVEAHLMLLKEGRYYRLHLVTSAPDREIEYLLNKYAGPEREWICLHSRATDAERDRLLEMAWAAVAPSLEEGYGYSLDEATRLGTRVVASLIPAHLEHAKQDLVVFVPPGNPGQLASALCYIAERRIKDEPAPPANGALSRTRTAADEIVALVSR